jgi:hypothetical protein
VLDHQHYLIQEEGAQLQPPEEAARTFVEEKPARKTRSDKGKKRKP